MRAKHLQTKDMMILRESDNTWKQAKSVRGVLKDYSLKHRVEMSWDLNEEAKRDLIFKLKIDDYEVHLDWEEMQRYGRWI